MHLLTALFYNSVLFIANSDAVKCFSCATTNMKSNFLTKQRGPPNRAAEPRIFDDNCNSDTWIIKDRSSDDCGDGYCFKWQQQLNNSGSYSTMTFRGCYNKLYNINDPSTFKPPNHSYCTVADVPLACLSDSSVIEHTCWCQADYCNSSPNQRNLFIFLTVFLYLLGCSESLCRFSNNF